MKEQHKEPMVGVVVVTHGPSAEHMVKAAEAIIGHLEGVTTVSVSMEDTFPAMIERVGKAADSVERGRGVLLMMDIQGSSPFQACMAMLDGTRAAEVLCGVNLPMLLKLSTVKRSGITPVELAELLRDVGRRSIRLGSELTGRISTDGAGTPTPVKSETR